MTFTEEQIVGAVLDLYQRSESVVVTGVLSGDTYTLRNPVNGQFAGSVNVWNYYHELEKEFGAKNASEEFLGTILG